MTGTNSICALGLLNHALALFQLARSRDDIARANSEVAQAIALIPRLPGYPSHDVGALRTSLQAAGREPFHFMLSALLFRIVAAFGRHGTIAPRLQPDVETGSIWLFGDWAHRVCRLDDADPGSVWRIWASENHSAQRDGACWAAAMLLAGQPADAGVRYADGSDAPQQLRSWTRFLKAYLAERGQHGLGIEFFSPTYTQYSLQNDYLYADFSADADLRRLARDTLILWWAEWAQEELDGVDGGPKARMYDRTIPSGAPLKDAAWLYLGQGGRPANLAPGIAGLIASPFRLPAVVAALAAADRTRGPYEISSRVPGLAVAPRRGVWYQVDPRAAVLRYVTAAPDFIMGTAEVVRRPASDWTEISAQNRVSGVIFAGRSDARIMAVAAPDAQRATYNAVWGVQSHGTQIIQRIAPPNGDAGAMRLYIGGAPRRIDRGGWIFVAYRTACAAIWPGAKGIDADQANPGWYRLRDADAPIVIQAVRAGSGIDSLESLARAVLTGRLEVSGDRVVYHPVGGGPVLSLPMAGSGLPTVAGVAIDPEHGPLLQSPYLNQVQGSDQIVISAPAAAVAPLILSFAGG